MRFLFIAAVGLMIAFFFRSLFRANELAAMQIQGRQVHTTRGQVPSDMIRDLQDVVRRSNIEAGWIRLVHEGGRVRLVTNIAEPTAQQLRNVCAIHQTSLRR